jgi:pimeloyl-ACP methyl ester carboxylesterase
MLVNVHGVRLHVLDEGQGDPPLVFLHGNGGDVTNWAPQVAHFSETHRIVRIDMRGFGKSDRTYGTLKVADYASDIDGILDQLGIERCVVVGLSLGGMTALQLAVDFPERFVGLVVSDSSARLDDGLREVIRTSMNLVLEHGLGPLLEAFKPALFAPATLEHNPEVVDGFLEQFASGDPFQHYLGMRSLAEFDLLDAVEGITIPTLVMVGESDQTVPPPLSIELAEAMPNARLVVVEDAGHLTNLEQPERFNTEIDTLLASL